MLVIGIPASIAHHLPDSISQYMSKYKDTSNLTFSEYVYPPLAALLGYYLLSWLLIYLSVLRQVRGLPTVHSFLTCFEPGQRGKMPNIPYFSPVNKYLVRPDFNKYDKPRSDLIAYTAATTPRAIYVTSSPTTMQLVTNKTALFLKPWFMPRHKAMTKFGESLVTAQNGADFRRRKAVVKGCFVEEIMRNAWDKMDDSFQVMLTQEGLQGGGVVEDVLHNMFKLTLLVIGSVGFSQNFPWNVKESSNGEMPFYEAMDVVEKSIVVQFIVPAWLMRRIPTANFRRYSRAKKDFLAHLYRIYHEKRIELDAAKTIDPNSKPPSDLLGAIVASQMDAERAALLEKGANTTEKIAGLTEQEIIANIFIFIVAGHETTAHTLTFTLASLALHPEWQEQVYQETKAACGHEPPTYRDLNNLPLCTAVCLEALRLNDLIRQIIRVAAEDTTVPYTTWSSDRTQVGHHTQVVKKGSLVVLDTPAAQSNPFHWTDGDAMTYNPRRHLTGGNDSQVPFTSFSLGPRACIGKRFAEVEMACFIAQLISRFTIHPVPKMEGETLEQMRLRMLENTREELTYTPEKFDIRLERRASQA